MAQVVTTPTKPEFVPVTPVAQRYGVAPATIWRWARERDDFPKPIKLGDNCTRWRVADLEQWEAAKRA